MVLGKGEFKEEPYATGAIDSNTNEPITADGKWISGKEETPVFKVDKGTFLSNANVDRKRVRFPTDAPINKFMQNTKHTGPFCMTYTDKKGNRYVKKVK